MAHELSFREDGSAELLLAGMRGDKRPAWHGLGEELEDSFDSDYARERGLCFDVAMSPAMMQLPNGENIIVPDKFVTYRKDTLRPLGVVGDKYQIVQMADAFKLLDGLRADGIIKYESVGVLRNGAAYWLLARLPSVDVIAEGDVSLRHILFSSSHDGTSQFHGLPTGTRVVCANTLRIATGRNVGERHSGDVKEKLRLMKLYLAQFDTQFDDYTVDARHLAETQVSFAQAKDYLAELFPMPAKDEGRGATIRTNKLAAVDAARNNVRQNIPSIRGTWWSLFNAVTETIDHSEKTTTKRSDRENAESRFSNLLDGPGADFKAKAFQTALAMV